MSRSSSRWSRPAANFPASKYSPLERCVRIAAMLPRKGVRDVAMEAAVAHG